MLNNMRELSDISIIRIVSLIIIVSLFLIIIGIEIEIWQSLRMPKQTQF